MYKRILAVVLCTALVISVLPVLSFSASADNSGFLQVRMCYQDLNADGTWSAEKTIAINDNMVQSFANRTSANTPIRITRFYLYNMSNTTCYFSFDINFGGHIPTNGAYPVASFSSLAFTVSSGVTAYSYQAADTTPFVYPEYPAEPYPYYINSSNNRTFFGKCNNNGYITFNNPVVITFRKGDSVSNMLYIFFRHVVIGMDSSVYLSDMEQYLSNIDSNVNSISDWMEEEHDQFQSAWDNGASTAYDDYSSDNGTFFGNLLGILGLRIFSWHWDLNIFNASNNFFSSWFSQNNSDNINGAPRRSPEEETEYVDYYSRNQNGDLDIFGVDNDD